ncbi:NPL domain-containing protein [Heracleum sosnowskyi]|uniref:peptidylprolyl isomerase n=1 Tax=Heracleum sosnowskyi TaxID=360622 RepID=A0AAD8N2D0_9APIA|nr:NPL domain-containing protein [Heracleum sosnowskyi]
MAFWGIEVKPGKPFALKFDDGVRRRLHISQATLAIGAAKETSLVQCNVGDKSPVFLCALLPEKSESLQLNLEFDEDEEVLFSVIGPRGVHLTGFYTGDGRNLDDNDSESYGEDIANSENEESVEQSDEDEYEDSFIDDDDNMEVLPPSPVSSDAAVDDDNDKKRNKTNTNKRLKKRSQVVESDESDGCVDASKPKVHGAVKNGDPKRTVPNNKGKGTSNEEKLFEAEDHSNPDDEAKKSESKTNDIAVYQDPHVDAGTNNNPDHKAKKSEAKTNDIAISQDPVVTNEIDVDPGTDNRRANLLSSPELGLESDAKPKNKRKERSKEEKIPEANTDKHLKSFPEKKYLQSDTGVVDTDQDLRVGEENDQRPSNNTETGLSAGSLLPTLEESSEKPKSKRRKREQEQKTPTDNETGLSAGSLLPTLDEGSEKPKSKRRNRKQEQKTPTDNETGLSAGSLLPTLDEGSEKPKSRRRSREQEQKTPTDNETGLSAGSLLPTLDEGSEKPKIRRRNREQEQKTPTDNYPVVPERTDDENTSVKATKKKKQKSKVQNNDENMDVPVSLNGEKENSINEVQEENVITGSSQVRTLSNGLVIEDLESSKSKGKAAALGRKLKVQYTAKLKENGEIIDSNGKAPYRFCLGDEDVMEGWNIGLDGMHAGDKRRLVVPPSLRNGSRGTAENVPPDSLVIYDVELLSVR